MSPRGLWTSNRYAWRHCSRDGGFGGQRQVALVPKKLNNRVSVIRSKRLHCFRLERDFSLRSEKLGPCLIRLWYGDPDHAVPRNNGGELFLGPTLCASWPLRQNEITHVCIGVVRAQHH